MEDGTNIQTLMSLKAAEEMLPEKNFIRVHRSFIVNIDKVKIIERNNIVFGKQYIPISDSYRDNFNRLFSNSTINW
jgi:DNA-binding LytR/AlgR family response regulator